MIILHIIRLALCFHSSACAQTYSHQIDSIYSGILRSVTLSQKLHFDRLHQYSLQQSYRARIDSADFGYAYLEEVWDTVQQQYSVSEYYFHSQKTPIYRTHDTRNIVPDFVYQNSELTDHRLQFFGRSTAMVVFNDFYEYYYTLDTILQRCAHLKSLSESVYDSTPYYSQPYPYDSTMSIALVDFKEAFVQCIRTCYRRIIFIDNNRHSLTLSAQTPVQNPFVKARYKTLQIQQW